MMSMYYITTNNSTNLLWFGLGLLFCLGIYLLHSGNGNKSEGGSSDTTP